MLRCRQTGTSFAFLPAAVTRFFCALILLVATRNVQAGSWTWSGIGGNVNWSTGANWGGTAPGSANTTDLTFGGTTNTGTALIPLNQNINATFQLRTITFATG